MHADPMNRRQFFRRAAGVPLLAGAAAAPPATQRTAEAPDMDIRASNPKIKEAWDAGLRLLQPDARDLEHGLALHRASVVFDAVAGVDYRVMVSSAGSTLGLKVIPEPTAAFQALAALGTLLAVRHLRRRRRLEPSGRA